MIFSRWANRVKIHFANSETKKITFFCYEVNSKISKCKNKGVVAPSPHFGVRDACRCRTISHAECQHLIV